jgi:hypothetical protein
MNITRNTVVGIITLAALSVLMRNVTGATTETTTAPARHYYVTKATVNGSQALTACAAGYHFASYAEIADPALLTYNAKLGLTAADDGAGPPSYTAGGVGWVRSGFSSNSQPSGANPTNCSLWTSANSTDSGEVAVFDPSLGNGNAAPVVGFGNGSCSLNLSVWCVQN